MRLGRPSTRSFSVMEFFFWGAIMSVEGFIVPYLVGAGFTEQQAGLVMAAIYLVSVGSTPVWGYLADRSGRHRQIICISMAVSIVAVLAIRVSGRAFSLIVIFALVYSLTGISMPSLIDSWIMRLRRQGFVISYGVARGFGSFGYAAVGAVLGLILERHGLQLLFPAFAVIALVVILVTVITRDTAVPGGPFPHPGIVDPAAVPAAAPADGVTSPADDAPGTHSLGDAVRTVVSNGRYLVLVASIFVIFIGDRAAITFLPLKIYELGGTTEHIGWAQSVSAAFEIPFMFLSAFVLTRVRPRAVIFAAMSLFIVKLVLNIPAPSAWALVLVQLLRGPSMGFLLPAAVHYIDRIAPPQYRSLFQTLAPAVYFGLASVTGSAVGGAVVEGFGLDTLYIAAPIVSAVGVGLFGVLVLIRRQREKSAA